MVPDRDQGYINKQVCFRDRNLNLWIPERAVAVAAKEGLYTHAFVVTVSRVQYLTGRASGDVHSVG